MSDQPSWKISHILGVAMMAALFMFGVYGATAGGNSALLTEQVER